MLPILARHHHSSSSFFVFIISSSFCCCCCSYYCCHYHLCACVDLCFCIFVCVLDLFHWYFLLISNDTLANGLCNNVIDSKQVFSVYTNDTKWLNTPQRDIYAYEIEQEFCRCCWMCSSVRSVPLLLLLLIPLQLILSFFLFFVETFNRRCVCALSI